MKHTNVRLLRRVPVADLKVGDLVVDSDGDEARLVAPTHPVTGELILSYKDDYGYCVSQPSDTFYLPPLGWVEDKPVYPGDVLYRKGVPGECQPQPLTVVGTLGDWRCTHPNGAIYRFNASELTWSPPRVRKHGWVNVYEGGRTGAYTHPTQEAATRNADPGRKGCVHIEWEE